jgi:hypothetical protein
MKEKKSSDFTRVYQSSALPQILSALWRVSIDLRYLNKTLIPHDLYSLKLKLYK